MQGFFKKKKTKHDIKIIAASLLVEYVPHI